MASEVDIYNLALAHLGQTPNIAAADEKSVHASFCRQFYPIARDAVLESHCWRFATRRAVLALLSVTPPAAWLYAYAMPNQCLRPIAVLLPGGTDDEPQDFAAETLDTGTQVIYTSAAEAAVTFIHAATDTARFSPLCVNAIAWLLASYLAGPITKNPRIKDACYRMYVTEGAQARAADANTRRADPYSTAAPSAIAART